MKTGDDPGSAPDADESGNDGPKPVRSVPGVPLKG
jgi:hypothetical protein